VDVVNDTQCVSPDTLNGSCTWIYRNDDAEKTHGVCMSKSSETFLCSNLNRTDQCLDGGGFTSLKDKCKLYGNNKCGQGCEYEDSLGCSNRNTDCFLLRENEMYSIYAKCKDLVFIYNSIFFFSQSFFIFVVIIIMCMSYVI
jgi:hypothetical protein